MSHSFRNSPIHGDVIATVVNPLKWKAAFFQYFSFHKEKYFGNYLKDLPSNVFAAGLTTGSMTKIKLRQLFLLCKNAGCYCAEFICRTNHFFMSALKKH